MRSRGISLNCHAFSALMNGESYIGIDDHGVPGREHSPGTSVSLKGLQLRTATALYGTNPFAVWRRLCVLFVLSVRSCPVLYAVCIKAGELELALDVFQQLLREGCTPNLVTYNILIDVRNQHPGVLTADDCSVQPMHALAAGHTQ